MYILSEQSHCPGDKEGMAFWEKGPEISETVYNR